MDWLKLALKDGIIDVAYVQAYYEMNKRKEQLEQHKYHIWCGEDGKWRTYLPDSERGRKLLKRKTQKDIEDAVAKFYREQDENAVTSFRNMYYRWRSVQDRLVCDNTITKYDTEYKRYFENAAFADKDIASITEEHIKVFICETVKNKKLCKKACKTLFGYVSRVMESARINHIIADNPMEYMKAKDFYKYCTEIKRPVGDRIITDEDMEKLYGQFRDDYARKPSYIPTYAVEFASLTGMRVAEISALRWANIKDSYILVDASEKYNRKTQEYYIDSTKNGKERIFPVTKEIQNLLERIKKVQLQYGFICEWVFADKNGRIHAPVISSCSKNKCRQIGISDKGIHAYRRTVNSKMRCGGVSATVAAALLGHSADVNNQYYTFDTSGLDEKMRIVESVNKKMPIAN